MLNILSLPSPLLLFALGLETYLGSQQPKPGRRRNEEKETRKAYCNQPGSRAGSSRGSQQLQQQCPWRHGSISYFQLPRGSNPGDGLALMFVSFWLFMATWYMPCWFLWSIITTFFPPTCSISPILAAITSPLAYCSLPTHLPALSFASWTTTLNPFSRTCQSDLSKIPS